MSMTTRGAKKGTDPSEECERSVGRHRYCNKFWHTHSSLRCSLPLPEPGVFRNLSDKFSTVNFFLFRARRINYYIVNLPRPQWRTPLPGRWIGTESFPRGKRTTMTTTRAIQKKAVLAEAVYISPSHTAEFIFPTFGHRFVLLHLVPNLPILPPHEPFRSDCVRVVFVLLPLLAVLPS